MNAKSGLSTWTNAFLAVLFCLLTAWVATPLRHVLSESNIVMLFLLVVVLISVTMSRAAGVTAAFSCVLLFDVFFVEPRFSLSVNDAQYLVTFGVMLLVALVIGALTSHLRDQALASQQQAAQSQYLYEFAKTLASSVSVAQVIESTNAFLKRSLGFEAALVLPKADESLAAFGETKLRSVELLMAQSAYDSGQVMEMGHHNDGDSTSTHLPLHGSTRMRGVLVVRSAIDDTDELLAQRKMLEAVSSIVAASVERLHFVDVAQGAQWQIGSERLRSSILSALSHDIRTPLTALYGLADSLHFVEPALPAVALTTSNALCAQVTQLNTMVGNLLDMAKLQTGDVTLRSEWQPIEEVVGASIHQLHGSLVGHSVDVQIDENLPLLHFDAVLMERVFCNLLENAAKYANADDSLIKLNVVKKDANALISIENKGALIPDEKLKTIFNLFERGQVESNIHGTGIGLSICSSIVHAHGGQIWAENLSDGVRVSFTLQLGSPPLMDEEFSE